MNFAVLWFVLLCCGLTLAQEADKEVTEREVSLSCFPDTCNLLKELGGMKAKLEAMEARLKDSEAQIVELKKQETTKVVFSAGLGGSGAVGPFDTQTTLIYKTVRTNVGNAYNQFTGIFAAPVAGTYYFTYFYHAGGSHSVQLYLMKNNEFVAEAYDHRSTQDTADNGGNAALLQLQRGDQVYVRLGANTHVWGNDVVTTFSGFLLHQD